MFYVGTCGYDHSSWAGTFYKEEAKSGDKLKTYTDHFTALETDFAVYRIPQARKVARWVDKMPEEFLFSVRCPRSITHDMNADDACFRNFSECITPMYEAGKLGSILFQFPWSFALLKDNVVYLAKLIAKLESFPLVVEFRNNQWAIPRTYQFLEERGVGWCCVDEPRLKGLMPPVALATSRTGYVRFHGRNGDRWWRPEHPWERHDYTYNEDELMEWVPGLEQMEQKVDKIMVFFSNTYMAQAPLNAIMMRNLLEASSISS